MTRTGITRRKTKHNLQVRTRSSISPPKKYFQTQESCSRDEKEDQHLPSHAVVNKCQVLDLASLRDNRLSHIVSLTAHDSKTPDDMRIPSLLLTPDFCLNHPSRCFPSISQVPVLNLVKINPARSTLDFPTTRSSVSISFSIWNSCLLASKRSSK